MNRLDLPMERIAAAGRTDITSPATARDALHVDPQEAYDREVELAQHAARINANTPYPYKSYQNEHGIHVGLTAYRECYEFAQYVANLDPDDIATDCIADLVGYAQAAIEGANG